MNSSSEQGYKYGPGTSIPCCACQGNAVCVEVVPLGKLYRYLCPCGKSFHVNRGR
jgi:hypothetical protein